MPQTEKDPLNDLKNFLNRMDAEAAFAKKKKLKNIDISKIAPDVLPDSGSIATGNDDDLRNVSHVSKKRLFISQNFCPCYKYLYGLVTEKKPEGIIYDFWVFNGIIRIRQLQDLPVVGITHESDI